MVPHNHPVTRTRFHCKQAVLQDHLKNFSFILSSLALNCFLCR
uniref:Uncharacterized protein n=1 Tax=Lepeophtheirus salmonis TaxID=72036 RepID=A0A0K2UPM2_LEPSM